MKNSLETVTGNLIRTDYSRDGVRTYGPSVIQSGLEMSRDSFVFSGGGSNDPRRKTKFSDLAFTKVKERTPTGVVKSVYFSDVIEISGALVGQFAQPADVNLPEYQNLAYNEALADLYERIRNSDIDIAVTVAELPETALLVRQLSASILKMDKVVRKNIKRYNKVLSTGVLLKDASAAFLIGHLAIEPLIKDTYAIMNDVQRGIEDKVYRFRSRKTRSSNAAFVKYLDGTGYLNLPRQSYGKASYRSEIVVEFQVSDPLQFRKNQLSMLDPEGIAWELLPMSFVFDYFINVSQYLQSLENSHRNDLKFLRGYVVNTSRKFEKMSMQLNTTMPGSIGWFYADVKAYRETKTYQRYVLSALPQPKAPQLKPLNLGATRCLTIASLLTQLTLK